MAGKPYDLGERTLAFAKGIRAFVKKLPRTLANIRDGGQLINSSGSVGANWIEAEESLSKKDFLMRAKIVRKEAKESHYWLELVDTGGSAALEEERLAWRQEALELTRIFSSIIDKAMYPQTRAQQGEASC